MREVLFSITIAIMTISALFFRLAAYVGPPLLLLLCGLWILDLFGLISVFGGAR